MQLLAANNAQTVLAAGINASATAITVSSGTGALFPVPASGTSLFKLSLTDAATESVREIVHVTAVSGDVFTVVRGQEGTAARSWSANDIAANMVTAGTLSFFAQFDSPTFIGDPKVPTAPDNDNDSTIANTAFVQRALSLQGLGTMSKQNANAVAITGGTATLTTLNGTTVNAQTLGVTGITTLTTLNVSGVSGLTTLNVSGVTTLSGQTNFNSLDYLYKNNFVNSTTDSSNSTFGLRLVGNGGQRSDELFYEKIGQYAGRRFIVISGGNTITFDMRQDGSFVCLNPVGTWQIYPDGNISGTRWNGYLTDYLNSTYSTLTYLNSNFPSTNYVNSTFVRDMRLGSLVTLYKKQNTNVFECPAGYTFSAIDTGDVGSVVATARPIQKNINGTWYTVAQI